MRRKPHLFRTSLFVLACVFGVAITLAWLYAQHGPDEAHYLTYTRAAARAADDTLPPYHRSGEPPAVISTTPTYTPTPVCGDGWSVVSSPNVGAGDNYLSSVSGVSAEDMWSVGYYYSGTNAYRSLIERWDGTSWSIVPGAVLTPTNNYLQSVTAITAMMSGRWAAT